MENYFQNYPYVEHPWIFIEIKLSDGSSEKILTLIDTGFSGGLRLPAEYKDQIEFLTLTEDKCTLRHLGKIETSDLPIYKLKFHIIDQKKQLKEVSSSFVIFYGMDYAVLGTHFIEEWKSVLTVDGVNIKFSFISYKISLEPSLLQQS